MTSGLPDGAVPFHAPARSLGALDAPLAARAIGASADVAVVLDAHGIVQDFAYGNAAMASAGLGDWMTRPWIDTVTIESRPKIADMLRGDPKTAVPRWREINHVGANGDVPVRYLTLGLGRDGKTLAIGRDLRAQAALQQRLLGAQQAMERDYLRLRHSETRYRALFELSSEAVFVVDSARTIVEANPAAHRLAGQSDLTGRPFASLVSAAQRDEVVAVLGAVAAAGQDGPAMIRIGGDETEYAMSATLFRQDRATLFLIRIALAGARADARDPERLLLAVVERVPEAFVVTDDALTIVAENAAFLDLTGSARATDVRGQSLSRFLGRPGIDLPMLVEQLREHGTVTSFPTVARGLADAQEEVEVTAVAVTGERPCLGFSIRGVARRSVERAPPADLPRSVEQLTELVGRVSLKEIVRESSDLIERLCIEAALNYTGDNRASAAEILGLSRQSLYSKLHRHGLGNLVAEPN